MGGPSHPETMTHALLLGGSLAALLLSPQDPAPATAPQALGDDEETAPSFVLSAPDLALAKEYFLTCDHDLSGTIVFSEAHQSLGIERPDFSVFDRDSSGDITEEEFIDRFSDVVQHWGGFAPPNQAERRVLPPEENARQVLNRWDDDSNRSLDAQELGRIIEHYGIDAHTGEEVLDLFDQDGDRRLQLGELEPLTGIIQEHFAPDWFNLSAPEAESVVELFGTPVPREKLPGTVAMPPQIIGPVPIFHRLDIDRDGAVSLEDLVVLQTPMQVRIQPRTVLNSLDVDRDGVLSESEFRRAMGAP